MGFSLFILIVTIATSVASPIHLLMPHSGSAGLKHADLNCLSWRLAVETDNLKGWSHIPESCVDYVGHYMLGKQYREDCDLVAAEAYEYAKGLNLTGDGKDVWVFDIDETTLSNIPYYARDDVAFGFIPYNSTKFNQWVAEATAPAIPGSLKLYEQLIELGFKVVFLTGSREYLTEPRSRNLKAVGYTQWEKLILKGDNYQGNAVEYKSGKRKELEEAGYRIRGNMGDQWSDLIGTSWLCCCCTNTGDRTFKVPDPMYYIG
ncbi:putative Acid phosphatase [Helianthus annuus]|nr:putative Acid phosphatase [Helianthus annuus]KAJ0713484.1 putative Acid phosphatase [Helianthus annuus]